MIAKFAITFFCLSAAAVLAQNSSAPSTNSSPIISTTNAPALNTNDLRALTIRGEQIRAVCVENRRYICGRILKMFPDGLVVESGYTRLLKPPLNHSWLAPGTAVVEKDEHLVESKEPGSVCVGLVFLTDLPRQRRLKPKQYDYVVLLGYPAGERTYTSVGTVQRTVRRYSAGLETAVRLNLQSEIERSQPQARASASDSK